MPWCPNCKVEYVKGTKICGECGLELVGEPDWNENTKDYLTETDLQDIDDESEDNEPDSSKLDSLDDILEEKTLQEDNSEEAISSLDDYDEETNNESSYYEDNATYENDLDGTGEGLSDLDYAANEDCSDDEGFENLFEDSTNEPPREDQLLKRSSTYVKKADKYTDLKSTASTFLFFGIAGIIFIIINLLGILTIITDILPFTVMTLMFIGFIYIGISSYISSNKLKNQIGEELDATEQINNWLTANITTLTLNEINDDTLTDEVNYFHKIEYIKNRVLDEFKGFDEALIDQLIEDYYNENF